MTNSSTPIENNTTLSHLDIAFYKLEAKLNLLGGIIIGLLVLLTVINVLSRWLFNLPITGYIDWIEQAMAFFALLGIAYCQRLGAHIRMDIFIGSIHGRIRWMAELVSVFLMLLVTLLLIYGSTLHAWRAYSIGDSSMDINLPTWPAKFVVPIALTVLAIRLILQLWAYARAIRNPNCPPIAVPLNEDAATQSAQEAATVLKQKKPHD